MEDGDIGELVLVLQGVQKELMLLRKIQETKLTNEEANEYRTRVERNVDLMEYLLELGDKR